MWSPWVTCGRSAAVNLQSARRVSRSSLMRVAADSPVGQERLGLFAGVQVGEAGELLLAASPCQAMVGRGRRQTRLDGTTRPAQAPRGPRRQPCVPGWTEAAVFLSRPSMLTSMSIGHQPTGTTI